MTPAGVRERFKRGNGLLVKGKFHLTPQDLVEDAAEEEASAAGDDESQWVNDDRLVFAVATADGEYFRFKPEVLGFETPILLHRDAQPDWKWFSAERKVSILGVIESLGLERIVIGGPDPEAIPIPEYDDCSNNSRCLTNCDAMCRLASEPWFASTPSRRSTPKRC